MLLGCCSPPPVFKPILSLSLSLSCHVLQHEGDSGEETCKMLPKILRQGVTFHFYCSLCDSFLFFAFAGLTRALPCLFNLLSLSAVSRIFVTAGK